MSIAAEARTVQLPFPLFRSLLDSIAANQPTTGAAERLRRAGFDGGAAFHALLEEHLAAATAIDSVHSLPATDFWDSLGVFWHSLGWGTLAHRPLHAGIDELSSDDWVEAEVPGAGCQLTTGLFADVLSRVAGEDVAVLELECRGRGAGRCRFLIGGPPALNAVYERLSAGSGLEEALTALD